MVLTVHELTPHTIDVIKKAKIVRFDLEFNDNIDFIQDTNIEEIYFEIYSDFNFLLNRLPHTLRILKIPKEYKHKIDIFPPNLQELNIYSNYEYPLDNLPEGLLKLYLCNNTNYDLNNLPNTLEILRTGNKDIRINILPLSLKELILPRYHLYKIEYYPPNLLSLQLSYYYNYPLDNLPLMLDKLVIAGGPQEYHELDGIDYPEFSQPINDLPDSVSEIEICVSDYTQKITKLPNNLDSIMFHSLSHIPTPDLEIINTGQAMFYCRCMDCKNAFFQQKYM